MLLAGTRADPARAPSKVAGRRALFAVDCLFAVIKGIEYYDKSAVGITSATDAFFMYYFALAALHLAHAVVGFSPVCCGSSSSRPSFCLWYSRSRCHFWFVSRSPCAPRTTVTSWPPVPLMG
jgi:hypothetical protein